MTTQAPVEFRASPAAGDCSDAAIRIHAPSLSALKAEVPNLKIWTRASDKFLPLRASFNTNLHNHNPLAICRPTSVEQISAVVRFAASNKIDLSVRAGGHDMWGRSRPQDALIIDMREMDSIELSADRSTITIGGGTLAENSAKFIKPYGLATTIGGCLDVGQCNWAMIGGYNMFSGGFGMGVDQIISANIVDATGHASEADEETLWGIRGAGGNFGVVTSLTLKVYDLPLVLGGMIGWPLEKAAEFMPKYIDLLSEDFPAAFSGSTLAGALPGSPAMIGVNFFWASKDIAAGRAFLAKLEALMPPMVNAVSERPVYDILSDFRVPYGLSYACRTILAPISNTSLLDHWAKRVMKVPAGTGVGMSGIHFCHGKGAQENQGSCFTTREPHIMIELIGMAFDEAGAKASDAWVEESWQELKAQPGALKGGYASLMGVDEPPKQAYGDNWDRLVALKTKKDPHNVFKYAVPMGLMPLQTMNGV